MEERRKKKKKSGGIRASDHYPLSALQRAVSSRSNCSFDKFLRTRGGRGGRSCLEIIQERLEWSAVPFKGFHAHTSFPDKGEIALSHIMRLNWL